MTTAPTPVTTVVRTVAVADPGPLTRRLPPGPVLSWLRDGDGIVGWGELDRYEWTGADGAVAAEQWWQRLCATLLVEDEVGLPGTGPVAFGSLAFDARTASSALVVPRYVLGRRDGRCWLTSYGDRAVLPPATRPRGPHRVSYADGALTPGEWEAAVAAAVRRIRAGELAKVVLARDLLAATDSPVDPRFLLDWLAAHYPASWTYCVDGLVGATPELYLSRRGDQVRTRVLAGTAPSGAPGDGGLFESAKEREEHEYAVRNTAELLERHCATLTVPATPSLLRLPNVVHLATDIAGTLAAEVSSLLVVGTLHPTAAVCGTPTDVALDLIPVLERMDRGRYAGPVGWLDATGDGDWGIALRCAQVDGRRVRMFAGGGMVADSQPDRELAETRDKMLVMRDALEARTAAH